MPGNSHDFVRPADEAERGRLESLIRDDFARFRCGETLDDVKRRMVWSREDRGLYRYWLAIAALRAADARAASRLLTAAE